MPLAHQLDRLVALGLPRLAGMGEKDFRALAVELRLAEGDALVIHPKLVAPSALQAPINPFAGGAQHPDSTAGA